MRTLDKKTVIVDENLSKVIGVEVGSLVSYAEVAKGLHEYIKAHNLKKEPEKKEGRKRGIRQKFCFKCGAKLPKRAAYCDRCGTKQ